MMLAIQEANRGKGKTFTNPLVGAVIVSGDKIISRGAHLKYGEPHAEKNAIDLCKTPEKLINSTIYVTLEPCDHEGKQPPCTQAIIDAGIKSVVVAQLDPNPLVAGRGIQKLTENGIQVMIGVKENEARALNPHYNYFFEMQRPYIALKQAVSLDGKIALAGQRTQLTNALATKKVHEERADYHAILVGSQTVLLDNPNLTTNKGRFSPLRVVLDRRGRVFRCKDLKIFRSSEVPVLIFTEINTIHQELPNHVEVFSAPAVTISFVISELKNRNIQSIYVEGGSTIHDAFLAGDDWEELITYVTPNILGGNSLSSMSSARNIAEVTKLKQIEMEKIGDNIRISGKRGWYVYGINPSKRER